MTCILITILINLRYYNTYNTKMTFTVGIEKLSYRDQGYIISKTFRLFCYVSKMKGDFNFYMSEWTGLYRA